jgi:hypothetical protein
MTVHGREGPGDAELIVGSTLPSPAHPGGRSIGRSSVPVTRRLEPREIIAVDVDEHMDQAAAIEAASATSESGWTKAFRALVVAVAGVTAWTLLPRTPAVRPPIELPPALQRDDIALTPQQREQEKMALAAFRDTGPNAAIGLLQACIDSGTASHSLWATYLTVLHRLGRDDELLTRARAYVSCHPDRLEGAHFLAEGLVKQALSDHRVRKGFVGSKISDEHREDLAAAQARVDQSLTLLDQNSLGWSYKSCTAWRDCLHLDAARLYERRWMCRDAAFKDSYRDHALEHLDALTVKDAANATHLRLTIYERLADSWPGVFSYTSEEAIGSHSHTHASLLKSISTLKDQLSGSPP